VLHNEDFQNCHFREIILKVAKLSMMRCVIHSNNAGMVITYVIVKRKPEGDIS
jgi:hypothetical protein